jgi:hypothetical protein
MPAALPNVTIDQITQGDPQTIADEIGVPIVWADHQATRRQRLHGANIPGMTHAYSSTHFNEILDHLHEAGYQDCIFICETPRRKHLAAFLRFEKLE